MGAQTTKKVMGQRTFLPRLLPHFVTSSHWLAHNSTIQQFNASEKKFASLAPADILHSLKENLLEIDIATELSLLESDPNSEKMLEITVPVCGLLDLLGIVGSEYLNFACVMSINGFGAKAESSNENNFPRADYVRMTDIVGNQFEIFVDAEGKVTLPEIGTGLFSIPHSLTFIYNTEQVIQGRGLEEVTSTGCQKNKLYLLVPTNSSNSFAPYICVTHLSPTNVRMVDSIRRVSVQYDDLAIKAVKQKSTAKRYEEDISELLYVDVLLSTSHQDRGGAFSLSVSLEPMPEVGYSFKHLMKTTLPIESHGWKQHPILSNVYTKQFGLSANALRQLIHVVYSELDFMIDYMQGDAFNLSLKNGYNQFLIHKEAFTRCYDLLVHDLINRKIPGDFLINRISDEKLINLDVSDFKVDFHDSIVLSDLKEHFSNYDFEGFKKLFLEKENIKNEFQISDYFYVYALGLKGERLPKVSIDITQGQTFSKNLISSIEANLQHNSEQDNIINENLEKEKEAKSRDANASMLKALDDNDNLPFKPPHERRQYTPSRTETVNKEIHKPAVKKKLSDNQKRPPTH